MRGLIAFPEPYDGLPKSFRIASHFIFGSRVFMTKDWKIGICGMSLVAIALLVYALFGRPPYAFFSALKWTVAASAALGAWALYTESKRYLPVSAWLLLIGGIHLFGRMRRHQWASFNWMAAGTLVVLVLILLLGLRRHTEVGSAAAAVRKTK